MPPPTPPLCTAYYVPNHLHISPLAMVYCKKEKGFYFTIIQMNPLVRLKAKLAQFTKKKKRKKKFKYYT